MRKLEKRGIGSGIWTFVKGLFPYLLLGSGAEKELAVSYVRILTLKKPRHKSHLTLQ